MPRTKKGTPPSCRLHASGQAVVTVRTTSGNRRDILLGSYDTDESKAEYARVLGVLSAHRGRYPDATAQPVSPSVNEVILAFWKHAESHYRESNKELEQYRYSLRPLREMYGDHPADKFTPKCLKAVRQGMADRG